jgi:hypothetical protein
MPFAADCQRHENGVACISTIGNRRLQRAVWLGKPGFS